MESHYSCEMRLDLGYNHSLHASGIVEVERDERDPGRIGGKAEMRVSGDNGVGESGD